MSFDENVKKALRDTEYLSNSFDAWGNKREWHEDGCYSRREKIQIDQIKLAVHISNSLEGW